MTKRPEPELAQGSMRAHGQKRVEAENRRRQNQREGNKSFEEKLSAPAREGKRVGDGSSDDEEDGANAKGQPERKKKRLRVHSGFASKGVLAGIAKPYFSRIFLAGGVFRKLRKRTASFLLLEFFRTMAPWRIGGYCCAGISQDFPESMAGEIVSERARMPAWAL